MWFTSSQLDNVRGKREGVQESNAFNSATFKKKVSYKLKPKKQKTKHKWIPFDSCFQAPTPSSEEERPPDHFPAKCGEWPNQQL